MLVAQTTAEQGPVHKLRTGTRRMEAQLALLALLPGLPPHAKEAAEVHRLLRRVRRAAASVRDLDVLFDLITADMPDEAALSKGSRGDCARKQAVKLLHKLERRRKSEAAEMLGTLHAESESLAVAMRHLQKALEPEASATAVQKRRADAGFRASELSDRVQQWFTKRTARIMQADRHSGGKHALQRLQQMNDGTLHDLRKAAKQCRYMAEGLPEGSSASSKLAERFEYLQQAGGRWHDWLMLEELAARTHGKKAVLAERYRHHREAALAEYHLQLALELTTGPHRNSPSIGKPRSSAE